MGLMDAIGNGLAEVGGGMAEIGLKQIASQIEQDRQAALMHMQEDIRQSGRRSDLEYDTSPEVIAKKGAAASGLMDATLPSEVNREKTLGAAKNETALAGRQAELDQNREDLIKTGSDPKALAATKNLALAKDIDHGAALRDIQVKAAQLTYDRAVEENKMPVAVDRQYKALAAVYEAKTKTIDSAMANGTFAPESDSAKQLLGTQAAVAKQMADLMKPYTPKAAQGSDKPASGKIDLTQFDAGAKKPAEEKKAESPPEAPAKPEAPPVKAQQTTVSAAPSEGITVSRGRGNVITGYRYKGAYFSTLKSAEAAKDKDTAVWTGD